MRVLSFLALTVACLFGTGSGDNGDCFFYNQVYKDGDTINYDCQICECTNGRITDCARDANCIFKKVATPEQNTDAIVYDDDDPNIIESSESKGNVRAKRAASGGHKKNPSATETHSVHGDNGFLNTYETNNKFKPNQSNRNDNDDSSKEHKDSNKGKGQKINNVLSKDSSEENASKEKWSHEKNDKMKTNERKGKDHNDSSKESKEKNHEKRQNNKNGWLKDSSEENDSASKEKKDHDKNDKVRTNQNKGNDHDHSSKESKENSHEKREKNKNKWQKGSAEEKDDSSKEKKDHEKNDKVKPKHNKGNGHDDSSMENKDNSHEKREKNKNRWQKGSAEEKDDDSKEKKDKTLEEVATNACIFNKESIADGETKDLSCSTCTCNKGKLTCVKNLNCPGVCSVTGYQMVRTFDGSLYQSPGTCNYILVKTSDFTISLSNKACSDQNPDAVCIDTVDIYLPNIASIKVLQDGSVLSAGQKVDLPFFLPETITVRRSSSTFLDVVTSMFSLQYDIEGNRLYVIIETSYKDQTSGLCGTYNDNRFDDFRSSSDITETVSSLFSKSWKLQSQCSEHFITPVSPAQRVTADLSCSNSLQDSIFADCNLIIDIHNFQASCSNSIYYGKNVGFCSAMADYAYRCALAGVYVPVSSAFPDCFVSCEGGMVPITENLFAQDDCAQHSSEILKMAVKLPLSEGCVCPNQLYYDSTRNECVDSEECPCYSSNHAYRIGENVTFSNGQSCTCERIMACTDNPDIPIDEVPTCPDDEVFSDCLMGSGKSCEPSCQNMAVIDQVCPLECQAGCICKYGKLRSNDGTCVPLQECPCVHGEDVYNPGETLAQDCNTCTCKDGKFTCTNNACNVVCNAYAGGQFLLFDNIWKTFKTGECQIILVESQDGQVPKFRVVMQNTKTENLGGALATKKIFIRFGGANVELSDADPVLVQDLGSTTQVRLYRSGFYVVAHFLEGLAVYYDQHLDVIIQLQPQLQGKVQGMCGDADQTTTAELAISNMAQYGAQFIIGKCTSSDEPSPPPTDNNKHYTEKRCSLLFSQDFAECHTIVPVQPYYTACVEETEACREGESCLCFCTALSAYARACCRKGINVDWRNPDTCPSPCEYYNRDSGEGPYRLVMVNGQTLMADYDTQSVSLITKDTSGDVKVSFMVTPSLFVDPLYGRKLISLESALHRNFFIVQNADGTLGLRKWQPSASFRIQATFILREGRWINGYSTLESYSSRGQYLSFNNTNKVVVMTRVKSTSMLAMNFKLTEETFGLPSFSICTWKYRSCGPACIPTCQDPLGEKCTLTLKVEGCFPICAPGMVFDEVTHRCVNKDDCVSIPTVSPTPVPPTPTKEPCKDVTCVEMNCKVGETRVEIKTTDPCCPRYQCEAIPTTPAPPTTPNPCKDVNCEIPACNSDEQLVQVKSTDPCCPNYKCECPATCSSPPVCVNGRPPIQYFDPTSQCCPLYECPDETTTAPPTTPELCKGVTCEIVTCAEGDEKVAVASSDPCCSRYVCVTPTTPTPIRPTTPESCKDVKCEVVTCYFGEIKKEVPSADPCCPRYECYPEPTTTVPTTPELCKYVTCPTVTCADGETKMEAPSADPCCPRFICVPETSPTPKEPCSHVTCTDVTCAAGETRTETPSGDPCCQRFVCVPLPTTTQPPEPCQYVTCADVTCADGETKMEVPKIDPCCARYVCVPQASTTPQPEICKGVTCDVKTCSEGEDLVAITSTDPCCSHYVCVKIVTLPPFTSTPIITQGLCSDVKCEVVTCTKDGETTVEIPSADPCCPRHVCECNNICTPPPICIDGRPPVKIFDPATQCCPQYECRHETTSTPPPEDICKGVTCNTPTCVREGEQMVEVPSSDRCCQKYVCECYQTCSPPITCMDGKPPMKIFDPNTQCCPTYECLPTITTLPPEPPKTTPEEICKDIQCPVITCTKNGSTLVSVKGKDPCCNIEYCDCIDPCPPALVCKSGKPTMEIDPEKDCCPKYSCPSDKVPEIPTTPSVTEPELTTTPRPPIFTTPPECANVKCYKDVTCRYNEIEIEETNPLDPCCPRYRCEPKTTPSPPELTTTPRPPITTTPPECADVKCHKEVTCQYNEIEREEPNPLDPCCPLYWCEPETTPSPPELTTTPRPPITTTPAECFGITCYRDTTCRYNEIEIEEPNPFDPCCPRYRCEPKTTPSTTMPATTKQECANVKCYKDVVCGPNDNEVEEPNPFDPCCPKYRCEPKSTTPSTIITSTSTIITTTKIDCSNRICVKISCRLHEKVIEKPNPDDPCCPIQMCECQCKTVPTCRSDERLVTVSQTGQCCPKLKCERKTDECHPVTKSVLLTSGQCKATVELNVCSGYCHSKTEYTSFWQPVTHCRCCSIKTDRFRTFQLPCADGTHTSLILKSAVTCGCNTCSGPFEPGSGSGSGSGSGEEGSSEGSTFHTWPDFIRS